MQNKQPTHKQINVFVFGLVFILFLFSWKAKKTANLNASLLLLLAAAMLVIAYFTKKDFVIKFYHAWMRCVSVIGVAVTGILMILIFLLIFTPVGLFLRLIKKDILNLNSDKNLNTYWIDKPVQIFDKSSYEKQF